MKKRNKIEPVVRTQLRLTKESHKKIKEICKWNLLSMNQFVQIAVIEAIRRCEKDKENL